MKKIIVILLLAVSSSAFAGAFTGWVKITQLGLGSDGVFVTTNASNPVNPNNCQFPTYVISKSNPNFNSMYALLLSAQVSDKQINVFVNSQCLNNRGVIGTAFTR